MDKHKADDVMQDVSEAIADVLKLHGLERTRTRGKYSDGHIDITLTLTELAPEGETVNSNTREARAFRTLAASADLDPELLGKTVRLGSRDFIVTGWNSRAPKNAILLRGVDDDKTYHTDPYSLKRAEVIS